MIIFCDIGGTHARFGVERGDHIADVEVHKTAGYKNFEDLVAAYLQGKSLGLSQLYVATNAQFKGDVWQAANVPWSIAPKSLKDRFGFENVVLLNDFEALAWGLPGLPASCLVAFTASKPQEITQQITQAIVIGCGTGVGIGHLSRKGEGVDVRVALGGHMAFASLEPSHREVMDKIKEVHARERSLIAEDVLSGPGLANIYEAVSGRQAVPEEILEIAKSDSQARHSLYLFVEFLGLFCHQAVIYSGHVRGLYLCGNLLRALYHGGFLEPAAFLKSFYQMPQPLVRQFLEAMAVFLIDEEHPAFYGLSAYKNAPR